MTAPRDLRSAMSMQRTKDPAVLVAALERAPDLDRGFDPAGWLADDDNVALEAEDGSVALFALTCPHVYEGHVLFACRGRLALALGADMLSSMFTLWGAHVIHGITPLERRQVRLFNRWLGFESLGIVATAWGACEIFYLHRDTFRGIEK